MKAATSNQAVESDNTESRKDSRLNLRVTPRQDHLIRRAAAALDKSVTEFVLDSVSLEAERVLAEQRIALVRTGGLRLVAPFDLRIVEFRRSGAHGWARRR